MGSSFDRKGLVLLVATIVAWAGSWIAMKVMVPYMGAFQITASRFLLGAAALFAVLLVTGRPLGIPPWKMTLLIGVTQTAGFQVLVQLALTQGGVGKVAGLAYTMPFWVIIFAWMILGERPGARQGVAFAFAAAGLICFLEPWHGLGNWLSATLAVGAGLSWGLGTVLSKRMFDRHAPDVMTFTAWQLLLGGMAAVPAAIWVPQPPVLWGWPLTLALLYSALIATAAAWLLWLLVLRRLPASIAGLSSLGVPLVATFLAWLLLNEYPTWSEISGLALIMIGLVVVSRKGRADGR
ncbi:DMT family transporter [Bordetella sp. 02P26C-1]|uniref:DMT family transporter n=1 Tax=Bordetella sp. 02P26C-1 TaxID=2683195 RepID=UPI003FA456D9